MLSFLKYIWKLYYCYSVKLDLPCYILLGTMKYLRSQNNLNFCQICMKRVFCPKMEVLMKRFHYTEIVICVLKAHTIAFRLNNVHTLKCTGKICMRISSELLPNTVVFIIRKVFLAFMESVFLHTWKYIFPFSIFDYRKTYVICFVKKNDLP